MSVKPKSTLADDLSTAFSLYAAAYLCGRLKLIPALQPWHEVPASPYPSKGRDQRLQTAPAPHGRAAASAGLTPITRKRFQLPHEPEVPLKCSSKLLREPVPAPVPPTETPGTNSPAPQEARMTKSKLVTTLIAIGAIVLTSTVTPASAARRHAGWRNAAVAAGIAAAVAAASGAYYSGYGHGGYGFGGYGYGGYGHYGRCGGGAYC
jgi:hypothetical protein